MAASRPDKHEQLRRAAAAGRLERVDELLRRGADPDQIPPAGGSALVEAIAHDHTAVALRLIDFGLQQASLDVALRTAAACVNHELVGGLLDAGAEVWFDFEDPDFFRWSIFFGNAEGVEVVRRLLASHVMARRLEGAMSDGHSGVRSPSGGPSPL